MLNAVTQVMAGTRNKKTAPSPPPQPEPSTEGPVITVLSKRLRACRKKLRRVEDVEAAVSQGKEINEEQRAVIASKPGLCGVIDELEKLIVLVGQALVEEVAGHRQHGYDNAMAEFKQQEAERQAKEAAAEAAKAADKAEETEEPVVEEKHDKGTVTDQKPPEKPDYKPLVEKVLQLLYFTQVCMYILWIQSFAATQLYVETTHLITCRLHLSLSQNLESPPSHPAPAAPQ